MGVDSELEAILKKWGSERAVYEFLRTEFGRINRAAFGGGLTVPNLKIQPMEPYATGNYTAVERNRPAMIRIFANVLTDEGTARRVLCHYMIHHWENTVATDNDVEDYPAIVDDEISKSFPTGYRERAWRSTHSRRFIAKACNVAKLLSIPAREVIFEGGYKNR